MTRQWLYSDTKQEYYSGKRVNWKMWTGNQGENGNVRSVTPEE